MSSIDTVRCDILAVVPRMAPFILNFIFAIEPGFHLELVRRGIYSRSGSIRENLCIRHVATSDKGVIELAVQLRSLILTLREVFEEAIGHGSQLLRRDE